MATVSGIFCIDYANTITVVGGAGNLLNGLSSGIIQLGKRRLFMVSAVSIETPDRVVSLSFTLGLSTGVQAPTPIYSAPLMSMSQNLVFDTGDMYDQIQLANVYNGSDSLRYSIVLLSKF